MKVKLTVLTLLVVGLFMVMSASAFATVTISKSALSIADANAELAETGIPATTFVLANDSTAVVTISQLALSFGGTYNAVADANYSVWLDADANGYVSYADTEIKAAAAVAASGADVVADVTDFTVPAGGATSIIVLIDAGTAANAETIVVGVDADPTNNVSAPVGVFFANDTTGGSEPTVAAGDVATITFITDAAQTLTQAAAATPVAAAVDVPNATNEVAILNATLTAGAGAGQVLHSIGLAVGTNFTGTNIEDEVDSLRVYIDLGTMGTLDAADVRIPLDVENFTGDDAEVVDLTTGIYVPASGSVTILVTASLTGSAATADDMAMDTDITAFLVGSADAAAGADVVSAAMTVEAMTVVASSKDFTGPPYNRPNGYLDALLLTFSETVDDATITAAVANNDVALVGHTDTFAATYQGDSANNNYVFLQINEIGASITSATPNFSYTAAGGRRILSADGEYGLADKGAAAITDAAPPAPRSVTMLDTDGNGKLDQIDIQLSEELTNDGDITGMAITGYTVTAAAEADPADGSDFAGVNSLWQLTLTELDEYDTGAKPNYAYDTSLNTLSDGTNQVASFNQLNVPVADGAAPTVVAAKTWDLDDDGKFDALSIDFSEEVVVKAGSTVDDLEGAADGFDFNGVFDTSYDFAATGHTLSGSQIILQVSELGSFDTAVQPVIEYNVGTSLIIDKAATPNALAAQVPFTNVASAAAVTAAAELWMQDGISARVTNGTWLDADGNGKLDNIELVFSENMGTTATTYDGLVIAGHSIEGAVIAGVTVTVEVDETGYDTGMKPDVTYASDTIVDANGAQLMALTSGSITELDGAYPVIYEAKTLDLGYGAGTAKNGQIDGIQIMFSEPMNTAKLDIRNAADTNDHELEDEFVVAGASAVADTVEILANNKFVIYLNESGASDSDAIPTFSYTAAGDSNLVDMNNLVFQDFAGAATTDGAPAAIVSAFTVDNNTDGFLDGILMNFSEAVSVAAEDTAKVLAGVTLEEVENAIDLSAATITSPAATQLQLVGTSAMGEEDWDTAETPDLSIAADNGISDAADNIVVERADITTTDGAAPVIGKAVGQVSSTNISIFFSEAVTNDAGAAIDQSDIMYWSATAGYAITSINDASDSDSTTFTAVTDSTLTTERVTNDKIRVVLNQIEDTSPAHNVAPVDTVAIVDAISPILQEAKTLDANHDGVIDNIKMTFSEAIKEANLLGWANGKSDSSVAVSATTKFSDVFTIPGFKVIGYNFTSTAKNASNATFRLITNSVLKGNDIPVANVGDVTGDAIIYLMVVPTEMPANGDTGVTPDLSFFGGADYAGIGDSSPNYTADVTEFQTVDGAPPILVSAEMDPESDGTIMNVWITESFQSSLPTATGTFRWLVGTEKVNYGAMGYIVNFQLNADDDTGRMYDVEIAGATVPPLTESTLAYNAGGVINDANGLANILTVGDTIAVAPWEMEPAVEEEDETDVPEVYALSKNFPNPFNPTTTINYDIAGNGGHVSLVIYNMTGQKVRTLVDEISTPGFYSAVWDGTNDRGENVASGIYLYKLVSGSFSKIEKMTFVK